MAMVIRKPYDTREAVRTGFEKKSRAKQSMRDECDINNIMKRFEKTGMISHFAKYQGRYEELPSDIDFQTAMNTIILAERAFASLPSKVRARFGNDPAEFLGFVQNPDNADELVVLGLAKPKAAEQAPADVPPAEPPQGG